MNNKKLAPLRLIPGKTVVEVLGGRATAQQLSAVDLKSIRSSHRKIDKNGNVSYDEEEIAKDMFRKMLVAIEGYDDGNGGELELTAELVEVILNVEPLFFNEFMLKSMAAFNKREDIVAKN